MTTTTGRQLFSTLSTDGTLKLELVERDYAPPTGNKVLVRMEAAPINPSDMFLLVMGADLAGAEYAPGKIVAQVAPSVVAAQASRHGKQLPVGNEGAGTVIAAGEGEMAQALLGQRVSCVPGAAYSEIALADATMCMPLGDHSFEEGAGSFVNPMTVLGFVETARREGHKSLVHAAAASNLGQMLNRVCEEDGIALVNIVRKEEQAELLRDQGATHIVNSSHDDFADRLVTAIDETEAFLGFDPIGGGTMTDSCLRAMERVAASRLAEFDRYGSNQPKKMYIYGRLDSSPTVLTPTYGFSWTVAGWLLTPFMASCDKATLGAMRKRVMEGLGSIFASRYKAKVSLDEMLSRDVMLDFSRMATGEKYLVTPQA